ncbi:hypothetical protein KBC75_06145, partial [Candidatus Shapirobacteria bacterium]|nr:hypothetical protein [Candidatus Shapirobacteria bacterium]
MISKKFLVPAFIVAVVSAGAVYKVGVARAFTPNTPNFIQYLAQKLGIEESKVQTVFNDFQSQKRADFQQQATDRLTTYLDGLVKENKITDAQKTAILNKHTELQKNKTDWQNKTPTERQTLMTQQRTDLEAWAKSQGIDIKYLQFGLGGRNMMGGRGDKAFGVGLGMMGGFG